VKWKIGTANWHCARHNKNTAETGKLTDREPLVSLTR